MSLPRIVNLSHRQLIGLLIVIGYMLLMLGNNLLALTEPDEVFYAQTAVEMVQHKSWLTPYLFGQPQFEKPILCYWLMALLTKVFGPSSFVARFWPAAFGITGLVVTYAIAWLLFKNKRTAFLSGLVLGTSFIYITLSRAVLTDMVFSILVAAAIGFFYFAFANEKYKQPGIILFFVFSALAVLAKGLLGLCFPTAVALIFLAAQNNLRFFNCRAALWGLGLFVLIAVPWHILMFNRYGADFVHEYFYNVHIRRVFEAEHQRSNTWYFYPLTMTAGMFPWVFFLFAALLEFIKKVVSRQALSREILFLLSWCLGIFIFVQLAQSKLASYVFPVFPAVAIAVAHFLSRKLDCPVERQRSLIVGGYLLAGTLVVVCGVAVVMGNRYREMLGGNGMSLVYFTVGLFAVSAFLLIRYLLRRDLSRIIASSALISTVVVFMLLSAKPVIEPWVSCRDISQALTQVDNSRTAVVASKSYVRGIRYFTEREVAVIDIAGKGFFSPHPIPFLNTEDKVLTFLASQPKTVCVLKMSDLEQVERIAQKGGYQVKRLADKGGHYLVSLEKPLAEVGVKRPSAAFSPRSLVRRPLLDASALTR